MTIQPQVNRLRVGVNVRDKERKNTALHMAVIWSNNESYRYLKGACHHYPACLHLDLPLRRYMADCASFSSPPNHSWPAQRWARTRMPRTRTA